MRLKEIEARLAEIREGQPGKAKRKDYVGRCR